MGMHKKWVGFFLISIEHRELQETMDLTVQDAVMHYANMVRDVVAGLQEVLKQEPVPVEASAVIQDTQVTHVVNAVQENQ